MWCFSNELGYLVCFSPVPENIVVRPPLGSNPATNDWIPNVEENQVSRWDCN
ncbi:hypothetical protein SLEP1_g8258 [Rubroshorea leprosula]|uniref:Uncharacterized protein n=1 Tax=Rubroshorea leprosula TaxID=152421 RepID=A0AAV5IAZ6_9ROSI|nr:hypothetical protein SLEP1_g8258 [Rubroshorea leprosula]